MSAEEKLKKRCTNRLWRILFFVVAMVYLELVFHIIIFGNVKLTIVYPIFFAASFGLVLAVLTQLFKGIGNLIVGYIFTIGLSFYFIAQLIYNRIFGTFFGFASVGGVADAMDFKAVLFSTIKSSILEIILLLVPVLVLLVLNIFFVSFKREFSFEKLLITIAYAIAAYIVTILLLFIPGKASYTPYNLFFEKYVMELSIDKLGLLVNTAQDYAKYNGAGEEEPEFTMDFPTPTPTMIPAPTPVNKPVARPTETNVPEEVTPTPEPVRFHIDENLDLAKLYENTEDKTLKNLTVYFASKPATSENEYTGMFKGYNVVFITAESLSRYAITKKAMPLLYNMTNNGFVFTNYYNPKWYNSTIDGEYINCLGQYPCDYDWSFYKSVGTYQPYALGNALNKLGYTSLAYHNYDFFYYDRSRTHPNMGYDFKAVDYGLDFPLNDYPYSDYEAMVAAMDEVTAQDKFNMYFMTFSGHMPYDEDNTLCRRHFDEAAKDTEGMDYPYEAICYIAGQLEFEKSLEYIYHTLEESGQLDNTLFVITPDHYPYALKKGKYDALAGAEVEEDKFELHHASLTIWAPSMERGIVVDKKVASVDILPTVLNLLGVEYDSRFLAGHDMLSSDESLIIYADHSFMNDKIKYDTATGQCISLDGEEVSPEYIDEMITEVENRLYISDNVINTDYFRFLYPNGK